MSQEGTIGRGLLTGTRFGPGIGTAVGLKGSSVSKVALCKVVQQGLYLREFYLVGLRAK